MASEKRKFTLYCGAETATRETILSPTFLEKIEDGRVSKLTPLNDDVLDFDAYYDLSRSKTPRWMELLGESFEVPPFSRRSPAAVVVFEEAGRVFAVTFGYGSKLLNEYHLEGDFGVKVAINAVADDSLRAVQKSNVASAIQQFAQSAFRSRFGSFGGQSKFEILKRVSGSISDDEDIDTVVGSAGLSLTTTLAFSDIRSIASKAKQFFESDAYKKTDFSVVDEFRAVISPSEVDRLNQLLVENLRQDQSSFELCLPQLRFDDTGYVKLYGVGLRDEFPDISLEMYKASYQSLEDIELDDLLDDAVSLYNDEHDNIGKWSVYRCLVGSLEDKGTRYVLNDAHWYVPSEGIVGPVESYFTQRKAGPDPKLGTFNIVRLTKEYGKKGKTKLVPSYEHEDDYNARIAQEAGYVLFDQVWHRAEDGTFQKLEVCDLYDPVTFRFIHVKRTSRQPNLIAYLFEQGQRAADLWARDDVRQQFITKVRADAGDDAADALATVAQQPQALTIEFAIADHENVHGQHTIPFLAKLSFENKGHEIERRDFKTLIRFITLAQPALQPKSAFASGSSQAP